MREPIAMCFSGGKDSVLALQALRKVDRYRVETLITTVTDTYDRVSMHGVRRSLVRAQAESLGIGLAEVVVPPGSSNEVYERAMGAEFDRRHAAGVRRIAFGDIFLADLREYRERQLAERGLKAVFPRPIPVNRGEVVERDGFAFCDLVPAGRSVENPRIGRRGAELPERGGDPAGDKSDVNCA